LGYTVEEYMARAKLLSTLKFVGTMGRNQTPFDGLPLFNGSLGCSENLVSLVIFV